MLFPVRPQSPPTAFRGEVSHAKTQRGESKSKSMSMSTSKSMSAAPAGGRSRHPGNTACSAAARMGGHPGLPPSTLSLASLRLGEKTSLLPQPGRRRRRKTRITSRQDARTQRGRARARVGPGGHPGLPPSTLSLASPRLGEITSLLPQPGRRRRRKTRITSRQDARTHRSGVRVSHPICFWGRQSWL
jgi:hypothetical protein